MMATTRALCRVHPRVTWEGWAKGVSILHFLGLWPQVAGDRAIAQTKDDHQPAGMVEGANGPVLCDVVCTGRFYDFVVRHDGQWKLLHRQPIYERTGSIRWTQRPRSSWTSPCWPPS